MKQSVKRVLGTLMLPGAMYLAMMALCYANGKMYFGTWKMWQTLLVDIALSVACAMGIGLQFKCGRFDFSGGAIMLVSAIVAGNMAKNMDNNIPVLVGMTLLLCLALSLLVAVAYVCGRVPFLITSIGFALLFEAVTCLLYGGKGINLVSNMTLRLFSTYPYALLPLAGAVALYAFFSYGTVAGRQAQLLANNQRAAVNIGVNERKNVIVSYAFSGLIFGCATLIYVAGGLRGAAFTSMSTVGSLFSNILPVFIGLMLAGFCGDTIGIVMGSVTLSLMTYALTAVFSSDMGTAVSAICMGVFVLVINVVSAQGRRIVGIIKRTIGLKEETPC